MTFLTIVDFHLGGLNEKETELNLCSIHSVSTVTVFGFFFLWFSIAQNKSAQLFVSSKLLVPLIFLTKTLIWNKWCYLYQIAESCRAGWKWSAEDFLRKYLKILFFASTLLRVILNASEANN